MIIPNGVPSQQSRQSSSSAANNCTRVATELDLSDWCDTRVLAKYEKMGVYVPGVIKQAKSPLEVLIEFESIEAGLTQTYNVISEEAHRLDIVSDASPSISDIMVNTRVCVRTHITAIADAKGVAFVEGVVVDINSTTKQFYVDICGSSEGPNLVKRADLRLLRPPWWDELNELQAKVESTSHVSVTDSQQMNNEEMVQQQHELQGVLNLEMNQQHQRHRQQHQQQPPPPPPTSQATDSKIVYANYVAKPRHSNIISSSSKLQIEGPTVVGPAVSTVSQSNQYTTISPGNNNNNSMSNVRVVHHQPNSYIHKQPSIQITNVLPVLSSDGGFFRQTTTATSPISTVNVVAQSVDNQHTSQQQQHALMTTVLTTTPSNSLNSDDLVRQRQPTLMHQVQQQVQQQIQMHQQQHYRSRHYDEYESDDDLRREDISFPMENGKTDLWEEGMELLLTSGLRVILTYNAEVKVFKMFNNKH